MTKEEKIKEAWGSIYESIKDSLNHTNGEFLIESCFFYEDDFYKKELFDTEVYTESLLIIRPKSILG